MAASVRLDDDAYLEIAQSAFKRIRDAFPHLQMDEHPVNSFVWCGLLIPQQPGLSFEITLNLQNADELYISTSEFCCSWFPCTDPTQADHYVDIVIGLIEGRYRFREKRRRGRVIKSELQIPSGSAWKTCATYSPGCLAPLFRRDSIHYIRNELH